MFSANQIERARKVIEKTYTDRCTVLCKEEYQKANGATAFRNVEQYKDKPCRLSFKIIASDTQDHMLPKVQQSIKLFIAPDIEIKAGSIIRITRENITKEYKQSGEAAIFPTHQEIVLDLAKEYA